MSILPSAVCAMTVPRSPRRGARRHSPSWRRRRLRMIDGDRAVGGVHPEVPGDVADPGVAIGALDHRGAIDRPDSHGAGTGCDLASPPTRSTAMSPTPVVRCTGLACRPGYHRRRSCSRHSPSGAGAVQRGDSCLAAHLRARGKLDLHVDRFAATTGRVVPPAFRCLDQQPALGVLDPRLPAAVTSDCLAGSVGRTSTMVSLRSLAAIRTSPTPSSSVTWMVGSVERGHGFSPVGGRLSDPAGVAPAPRDARPSAAARVGLDPEQRSPLGRATC